MSIHTDILAILAKHGPINTTFIREALEGRGYETITLERLGDALHTLSEQRKAEYQDGLWDIASQSAPQPEATPDKPITRDEAPAPVGQCECCGSEIDIEFLSEQAVYPSDPESKTDLKCDLCRAWLQPPKPAQSSVIRDMARMLNTLRTSILTRLK